ncbi:MAG: type II secretion system secretin GspD [Proteobacteria bacterium]|nr:type II secretion system protein GspD [Desulfobacteraceae bacterium]MBU4012711.1 type II secretion system secretin GspD [Pseudomonadota bacterium]
MVKKTVKISSVLIALTMALFMSSHAFGEIKKDEKVTFNFVDIDLPVIARFVSEITGKSFIFDERVKGKITIIAPLKISVADAFNLFTSILELKGFTVVPSGVNAYKIIPVSEARQRGISVTMDKQPVNESYMARLIQLKDIYPDDALKLIQPVVSKDGYVSVFGPANMLLVIDSGLNVEKILSIIKIIDQPSRVGTPEIVPLKYATADIVAKIINEGITEKPRPGAMPSFGEESKASADQRLNAVILFGDKVARAAMKSLISLLDVPSPNAQGMINIYFLENADATELSTALDGLIKGAQAQKPSAPIGAFEAVGGITITADKSSNALLIVASPVDYQNLSRVIKQLDKRRGQVFVEAMIAEVSIDQLLDLGTRWRAALRRDGEPVMIGGVGQVDQSTIGNIITGLTGLTLGGLANYFTVPRSFVPGATSDMTVPGLAALFSLSDFKGVVNVLSTPQILTSDNKEAEIMVGENVPFISTRERNISTTGTVLTSIERKDVGITLRITPQINEGDYVKLDIYQEISAVVSESENITISVGPTTTKRATKTSVVLKDKQTVVIGGLLQEREEEQISKVPVLGDIPLLGWLFKYKSVVKKKTNLLVFLTPHIIRETASLERLTREKRLDFSPKERLYERGELMIEFMENITPKAAQDIINQYGGTVITFWEDGVYHIKLKRGQDGEEAIRKFSAIQGVIKANPKYKINVPR